MIHAGHKRPKFSATCACSRCGRQFEVDDSRRVSGKFCSRACSNIGRGIDTKKSVGIDQTGENRAARMEVLNRLAQEVTREWAEKYAAGYVRTAKGWEKKWEQRTW